MSKLIILYGLPGSGKSTYSNEYCKNNPNTIHLNRDSIRLMFNCQWSKNLEAIVKNTEYSTMYNALESGYDVIIDDVSNLNDKTYSLIMNYVHELEEKLNCKIEIEEKYFNIPLEECIKRDSMREQPVGEKVIKDFYRRYHPKIAAATNKKQLELFNKQDARLEHAIIIDIDNTVSWNVTGRPWFGEGAAEGMKDDVVISPIVNYIIKPYPYTKIFVTGRDNDNDIQQVTTNWLINNVSISTNDVILFREHGDCRKGVEVKEELFLNNIKDKYFIDFVLEDDQRIANMYRKYGLIVLSPYDTKYTND